MRLPFGFGFCKEVKLLHDSHISATPRVQYLQSICFVALRSAALDPKGSHARGPKFRYGHRLRGTGTCTGTCTGTGTETTLWADDALLNHGSPTLCPTHVIHSTSMVGTLQPGLARRKYGFGGQQTTRALLVQSYVVVVMVVWWVSVHQHHHWLVELLLEDQTRCSTPQPHQ